MYHACALQTFLDDGFTRDSGSNILPQEDMLRMSLTCSVR